MMVRTADIFGCTGHLDRVLRSLAAEEVLNACEDYSGHPAERMANVAGHHHNMAVIRHGSHRGIGHRHHSSHHHASGHQHGGHEAGDGAHARSRAHPLMVQGLRTNPIDQDSHVLFFDIEALIVHMQSEQKFGMAAGTLEFGGYINQSEYQKYLALSTSPEAHKKASSGNMKNAAAIEASAKMTHLSRAETNLTMEISQLLLSVLHAWGLDPDLDKVCESKLGLLCPMRPTCFGLLSRGNHMSLLLPTHMYSMMPLSPNAGSTGSGSKERKVVTMPVPKEQIEEEERARRFSSKGHWELSTAVTTNHLLSAIALANTFKSMRSATFVPEQEKRRRLHRRLSRADSRAFMMTPAEGVVDSSGALAVLQEVLSQQQADIRQGWSLLAALHTILLPDLVDTADFKQPQVEILARRWQDRCFEVREAAQSLLLAELRRIGHKGRKMVVDEWAMYLPKYIDASAATPHISAGGPTALASQPGQAAQSVPPPDGGGTPRSLAREACLQLLKLFTLAVVTGMELFAIYLDENCHSFAPVSIESFQVKCAPPSRASSGGSTPSGLKGETQSVRTTNEQNSSDEDVEEERDGGKATKHSWSAAEARRKQSTAIVLLGVIGAEYGQEMEQSKRKGAEDQKKKSVVEGFGPTNYSLARQTSQALAHLLLTPPSSSLPAHSSLRRAAIDLIGRGFAVWQAYIDVSRVLLGLFDLCCDADKLLPRASYGLSLAPAADSCRTARQALSLIATSRPPVFITTLARETVLCRARPEMLRIVDLLISKMEVEVAELLAEVMEIVLHCVDPTQLKTRGLGELFPPICRFNMVSYCKATRRIAVGGKNGNLTIFELKASKSQACSLWCFFFHA
ncbi:hypothetical protein MRX96_046398 [Rhipicephalus microplus]